jgi:hypothetical protein
MVILNIRLGNFLESMFMLWHVNPLLGNDREISSYTIAVLSNGSVNNGRC